MKTLTLTTITRLQLGVAVSLCLAVTAKAQVNLGAAGNYAVLETGNGNISIANASNAGGINGNVGIAGTGNVSDSGTPINGNVVYSATAAVNGNVAANVSGTITQNSAALAAAVSAANAAELAAVSMAATSPITSITAGGTLNPGVYDLTTLNLGGGAVLHLTGGSSDFYVFNISGGLTLNGAQILAASGLNPDNILFNVEGGGGSVAFSGGLNQESILDGVILDLNGNVQITPGVVNGEIIGGQNIGIASGGSCLAPPTPVPVPEASTVLAGAMMLLPLGIGTVRALRRSRTA